MIVLHGLEAEIEVGGDLLRGRAGRELPRISISRSPSRSSIDCDGIRLSIGQRRGRCRRSSRVRRARPSGSPDQRRRLAALGDIAAGAGVEGGLHQRRLAVHAEHENACARRRRVRMFRIASRPLAPGIEMSITTTSGACVLKARVGVGSVVGLGDDAKVALVFQHAPVALPHDGMVVDQQDRNALGLEAVILRSVMRRAGSWRRR